MGVDLSVKILLLASAFNGLTQRIWCELREAGHEVTVELAVDPETVISGIEAAKPDLVLCPFLRERVPEQIWRYWRTVIIHPGPVGDRGTSSLDHAILSQAPVWGVTALQAIDEMDAGPIWATRTFAMPAQPPRKSDLYNGPVTDAAVACALEVVAKAADLSFVPTPLEFADRAVPGTGLLPTLRQADRAFSWNEEPEQIVRRIRAADGAPGIRTSLLDLPVFAYDAHVGTASGLPGAVLARHEGAVLVGTGGGSVWLGHLKRAVSPDQPDQSAQPTRPGQADQSAQPAGPGQPAQPGQPALKLPAALVLGERLRAVPVSRTGPPRWLTYTRHGRVGTLTFRAYNGALSTHQCRHLATALDQALRQDTRVLVVRGDDHVFSNGVHLNVIEAAADPAAEAWANIRAINAVCRQLATPCGQTIVVAYSGNAGAGGAMMGLGAGVTVARAGVVLNPYYDIGLYGSELHTQTLPARVGLAVAQRLLTERLPVTAGQAAGLGMIDEVGPGDVAAFDHWLTERAQAWAGRSRVAMADCADRPSRPLSYYEATELAEMARDMFDDRDGFAARRHDFVFKRRPDATPLRLATHRG